MMRTVSAVCATLLASFVLAPLATAETTHPVGVPEQCDGSLEDCDLSALERNAVRVLNEHFVAFGEGDLEGVMSHYGERSVIITQNGIVKGRDQIREYYKALFQIFGDTPSEDSTFVVDLTRVKDKNIYYTWHAATAAMSSPFGADTLVVEGNTFVVHTTAFILEFN